jgi:hypothetical protein
MALLKYSCIWSPPATDTPLLSDKRQINGMGSTVYLATMYGCAYAKPLPHSSHTSAVARTIAQRKEVLRMEVGQ